MSRLRQSQSRAMTTRSAQGEHNEQAMEYIQAPLSVQLPPRRGDNNHDAATHRNSIHDHSKHGRSSSNGSSIPILPSPSHPSASASFGDLKTDLLIHIFKFFLAPINVSYSLEIAQRRTTLLLINSAFNTLVSATPSLWAHIHISGPKINHARAQRALDHAGGVGLWWVFDLRNDDSSPDWATDGVVNSLFERYLTPSRMEQTTHLHIILNTFSLFSMLFRYFRFPAPVLQEFKVVQGDIEYTQPLDVRGFEGHPRPKMKLEDGVFAGHTPDLRVVQMHHTPKLRTCALFKSITGGGGAPPTIQYLDLSQQEGMHPETFYGLLEAISESLKTLVLRNAGPVIESQDSSPDLLSPWQRNYHQGLNSETRSYAIVLPSLTGLVIGGMTANYLASLLSTLLFRPLTSLGVHGISTTECEKIWGILSRQPALLSESPQYEQKGHSSSAFRSINILELFDLLPSPEMRVAYPRPVGVETRKNGGAKGGGFHGFLVGQESLTRIMIRRVGIEFVKALADMSHPENETFNIPFIIPAPALECLEACCIVDVYDGDLVVPEILGDVGTALINLLHTRLDCAHRIGRLHLDGDEWGMQKGSRDKFIGRVERLGEGDRAPIIHWDARAPFFADYYDSVEI